jgi:hypothetical protein
LDIYRDISGMNVDDINNIGDEDDTFRRDMYSDQFSGACYVLIIFIFFINFIIIMFIFIVTISGCNT